MKHKCVVCRKPALVVTVKGQYVCWQHGIWPNPICGIVSVLAAEPLTSEEKP